MHPHQTVSIVTDSTADIPEKLVDDYDIHVVPNVIIINGKSYEDGSGITREEFYNRLPLMKPFPTTSTPSTGTFENLYESLIKNQDKQVVSIHAASTLTGIYNSARLAAARFTDKVQVLDSGQLSLGLGFQVLTAAEKACAGANREAILEAIQRVSPRTRVMAMLDTLEYVRRSGRVSWARSRLGTLLSLKPFVEVKNGKVLSIGEARTRRKGKDHLKELILNLGSLERLAILHSNAEQEALEFLVDLKKSIIVPAQPLIVNITTIIGVYVGPNGLGFAAITKS